MYDEEYLAELLDRWDESRNAGRCLSVEELCRDRPELTQEMRRRLHWFQAMDWLDAVAGEDDGESPAGCLERNGQAGATTRAAAHEWNPQQVFAALQETGLVTQAELRTLERQAESEDRRACEAFVEELVAAGRLTPFQAAVVTARVQAPLMIGQYLVQRHLGTGGMGAVYQAVHQTMQRTVALKILPAGRLNSPAQVARFRQEVKAAGKLSHKNIAAAHDAGCDKGQHFFVMEHVPGRDLQGHVEQHGQVPIASAVDWTLQTAQALYHAHRCGVIHRDIKPANLILTDEGAVKVVDFGLAVARDFEPTRRNTGEFLTDEGAVLGTAAFMSPEQALDTRMVDERTDIYSLGATLYFLLTGAPPFWEETKIKTIVAHREQPIPSLSQSRDGVPPRLEAACRRMLAKRREDRFASMGEVISELGAWQKPIESIQPPKMLRKQVRWGVAAVTTAACIGLLCLSPSLVSWEESESDLADAEIPIPRKSAAIPDDLPSVPPEPANWQASPSRTDAARLQQSWADFLATPVRRQNSLGMQLALIPPGSFLMGSTAEDVSEHLAQIESTLGSVNSSIEQLVRSESPQHPVRQPAAFYMSIHEVTVGQFREFIDATGYVTQAERSDDKIGPGGFTSRGARSVQDPSLNWRSPGYPQSDQHPVVLVTWNDAQAFCRWLSQQDGLTYALPTESQWEYVCRAGEAAAWPPALESLRQRAHYNEVLSNDVEPQPVGRLEANVLGVHDMLGNAREWCADWYGPDYYTWAPFTGRGGPDQRSAGHGRVIRGGGLIDYPLVDLTPTFRYTAHPYRRYDNVGFRVVTANEFPASRFESARFPEAVATRDGVSN